MNTYSENQTARDDGGRVAHREGRIARRIEQQTAKIPSDAFLWMAGAAMIGSMLFQVLGPRPRLRLLGMGMGRHIEGRAPIATFIGQWVPTLLVMGLYNKIVKVAGSDRLSG